MTNKNARKSAVSVYSDRFMNAELNSEEYYWAFDRLRNSECGFNRSSKFMRHPNKDFVSVNAGK